MTKGKKGAGRSCRILLVAGGCGSKSICVLLWHTDVKAVKIINHPSREILVIMHKGGIW
jgi:hypothetical protein